METLAANLKYASRILLRNPGYACVAILTLALGIGANASIFSVVNAVLLRPLPYAEPERIVGVWTSDISRNVTMDTFSPPNFLDVAERSHSFEAITAWRYWGFDFTGEGEPERVTAALVSPAFFAVMGVPPALGRALRPEEDAPGRDTVVVIGDGLWRRRFGADPGIVGRSILLSGRSFVVVGVMPEGFEFPRRAQAWAPIAFNEMQRQQRGASFIDVLARLKPGVDILQAQAEMTTISAGLAADFPGENTGMGISLLGLREQIVGDVRLSLLVLVGAVAFVLLIGCGNLANLLLAAATVRQREFAIRAALGASRRRLAGQLLTESLLLAILGGGLGLLLALWGVDLLVAISPDDIPRLNEVSLDGRVLLFTMSLSVLTGFLFGLAPAFSSARADLQSTLKDSGRGVGPGRGRMRSALVSAEVALVLVLLVGAGLLLRSFSRLRTESPGFTPDHVLSLQIFLPQARYTDDAARRHFHDAFLEKLNALPGVISAASASPAPFSAVPMVIDYGFHVVGRPVPPPGQEPIAIYNRVSPGYFGTIGTPLLRGREFTQRDDERASRVAIVSDGMAKRFWPGEDPIGRTFVVGTRQPITYEIVGVAGDVKRMTLTAAMPPEIYVPFAQSTIGRLEFLVRTEGRPAEMAAAVKAQMWSVDKDIPANYLNTMDQLIQGSLAQPRFNAALLAAFAGLALILAMVGLYGVIAYSVSQRTREIGVRMALGAQRADIFRNVLAHGMTLTLAGIVAGLGAALALAGFLSGLLYGISALDPATYAGVTTVVILVALAACYLPARRATLVDPMVALRAE